MFELIVTGIVIEKIELKNGKRRNIIFYYVKVIIIINFNVLDNLQIYHNSK